MIKKTIKSLIFALTIANSTILPTGSIKIVRFEGDIKAISRGAEFISFDRNNLIDYNETQLPWQLPLLSPTYNQISRINPSRAFAGYIITGSNKKILYMIKRTPLNNNNPNIDLLVELITKDETGVIKSRDGLLLSSQKKYKFILNFSNETLTMIRQR